MFGRVHHLFLFSGGIHQQARHEPCPGHEEQQHEDEIARFLALSLFFNRHLIGCFFFNGHQIDNHHQRVVLFRHTRLIHSVGKRFRAALGSSLRITDGNNFFLRQGIQSIARQYNPVTALHCQWDILQVKQFNWFTADHTAQHVPTAGGKRFFFRYGSLPRLLIEQRTKTMICVELLDGMVAHQKKMAVTDTDRRQTLARQQHTHQRGGHAFVIGVISDDARNGVIGLLQRGLQRRGYRFRLKRRLNMRTKGFDRRRTGNGATHFSPHAIPQCHYQVLEFGKRTVRPKWIRHGITVFLVIPASPGSGSTNIEVTGYSAGHWYLSPQNGTNTNTDLPMLMRS